MKITQDTVVTLRYQVTDAKGALIDPGKTPMVYLHGGYDNVFPKVEAALDGQETGFQIRRALSPEDAFSAVSYTHLDVYKRQMWHRPGAHRWRCCATTSRT